MDKGNVGYTPAPLRSGHQKKHFRTFTRPAVAGSGSVINGDNVTERLHENTRSQLHQLFTLACPWYLSAQTSPCFKPYCDNAMQGEGRAIRDG